MSVKEMFVIPKDVYLGLTNKMSTSEKQRLEEINIEQVNVSCGPILAGVKRSSRPPTKEKDASENTAATTAQMRGKTNTAINPVAPPFSVGNAAATAISKPATPLPAAVPTAQPTSAVIPPVTPPPTLAAPIPPASTTTAPTPTSAPPPNAPKNVAPAPTSAPPMNASNAPKNVGAETSILDALKTASSIKPPRLVLDKKNEGNEHSAEDRVNTQIKNTLNSTQNIQELREIKRAEESTQQPRTVQSLLGNFNDDDIVKIPAAGLKRNSPQKSAAPPAPISGQKRKLEDVVLAKVSPPSSPDNSVRVFATNKKQRANPSPTKNSSPEKGVRVFTANKKQRSNPSPPKTARKSQQGIDEEAARQTRSKREMEAKKERERKRAFGIKVASPPKKDRPRYKE